MYFSTRTARSTGSQHVMHAALTLPCHLQGQGLMQYNLLMAQPCSAASSRCPISMTHLTSLRLRPRQLYERPPVSSKLEATRLP